MEIHHVVKPHPLSDGIDHINCYSKGKTELGRMLSHFAPIGFKHHAWGEFASLESAWHWLKTGKQHHHLKSLSGYQAKKEGKLLPSVHYDGFLTDVEDCVRLKIDQNETLFQAFKASVLPLTHYYAYGETTSAVAIFDKSSVWFEYFYNRLRKKMQSSAVDHGIRLAVVGSRSIKDGELVTNSILNLGLNIQEIISGGASGVDKFAEQFAKERNIPVKIFLADWGKHGKHAGFLRNQDIVDHADSVLAIHDGVSKGTLHSMSLARQQEIPLYIVKIPLEKQHAR